MWPRPLYHSCITKQVVSIKFVKCWMLYTRVFHHNIIPIFSNIYSIWIITLEKYLNRCYFRHCKFEILKCIWNCSNFENFTMWGLFFARACIVELDDYYKWHQRNSDNMNVCRSTLQILVICAFLRFCESLKMFETMRNKSEALTQELVKNYTHYEDKNEFFKQIYPVPGRSSHNTNQKLSHLNFCII